MSAEKTPQHRRHYFDGTLSGRDFYIVRVLGPWIEQALRREIESCVEGSTVLDVGCGEAPWEALVTSLGARYLGLDIEQNSQGTVEFVGAIDRELPADLKESFPLVLCTEVLEHVANWDAAFRNLRRLVAPGGRLILTVPFAFPLHVEPEDYFRVTTYGLAATAERYGFDVLQGDRLGHSFDLLSTVVADLSFLPERRTLSSRIATVLWRFWKKRTLRRLGRGESPPGVTVNSNSYLSNAFILQARKTPSSLSTNP